MFPKGKSISHITIITKFRKFSIDIIMYSLYSKSVHFSNNVNRHIIRKAVETYPSLLMDGIGLFIEFPDWK